MSLQTNLKGRLRNTSLPKTHGLMPVFEAVVNSIHAIEEAGKLESGEIILKINRANELELKPEDKALSHIIGFTIIDNGCGFNKENFISFETLDSEHKIKKGCRGVGRLLWLKAFKEIKIESHFLNEEAVLQRCTFYFNDTSGVYNDSITDAIASQTGTKIDLIGFKGDYREKVAKKSKPIANQLLEHILWYFVRDEYSPSITVEDVEGNIDIDDVYDEHMHTKAHHEKIKIKEHSFELTHIKFRSSANKKHQLAFCAANRLVQEESIQGKIPGLYGRLIDDSGEFTYTCYISSPYLNEHVRSERMSFDIIEDEAIDMLNEVSLKDIRDAVLGRTREYLKDILTKNIEAGKKRVNDFIEKKSPRYRPIIKYISEDALVIDPEKPDKDLELHLYAQLYETERNLIAEGHNIMNPEMGEHEEEYKKRLETYLAKVEDLKKSDLTNYVSHRKVIIDLLQKSIEKRDDGCYARENMIHGLIMPMRKDSNEISWDACNLWLVDERLAFHNYLASDKPLSAMPITGSRSTKEPDLLGLKFFDNPVLVSDQGNPPLASITVIEIKRPMRDDMQGGEDKDPIDQALNYLDKIREGRVTTKTGRPIPGDDHIPGYCYILCDLTKSMERRCRRANLKVTSDRMGYFGYNEPSHAYIEVISFDQLVQSAKERNRAFFDKLGLPSN